MFKRLRFMPQEPNSQTPVQVAQVLPSEMYAPDTISSFPCLGAYQPWFADLASLDGSQEVKDTPINSVCRLANHANKGLGSGWLIRPVQVGSQYSIRQLTLYSTDDEPSYEFTTSWDPTGEAKSGNQTRSLQTKALQSTCGT